MPDTIKYNQYSEINSFKNLPKILCHKFVIKEGIIIREIAVLKSKNRVNKRRLIVGNPIPIAPFMSPEIKNIIDKDKIKCSITFNSELKKELN